MNNRSILVVDDEIKIVDVIKSYLESSGYSVVTAYNGKAAIKLFDQYNPILVILDLMLPDISGEDICHIIRQKSRTPIIMLTAKVKEDDMLQGLNMGADDYMFKPFSPKELAARVKTVLRRTEREILPLSDEVIINNGEIIIDNIKHIVRKNGEDVYLTNNEYSILLMMSNVPNKVFTREELIDKAFKGEYEGFDRSIDAHIKNIRKKLTPSIIKTIHGVGYRFGGE